jgi:hypothetical protein
MTAMDLGNRTAPQHLPGATLSRDIAAGEHVEKEIDQFISRRHDQRVKAEGERAAEEAWGESTRAYEEKRRQVARLEWHAFHCGQAERHRRTLEALIACHEAAAERLAP